MSQSNQGEQSKESSSRYHLPAWFLERNIKTPSDLEEIEDHVPICQCKTCDDYKKSYDDIDTEDESPGSESTEDIPKPEEESHSSAEKHETSCEDAISYAKFAELRDVVATNMLWRHMRPKDSTVLFHRCSASGCSTCSMEPVLMNDIVTRVARSLGMAMISLSFEDLEELGSDLHAQDKGHAVRGMDEQTSEKGSTDKNAETPSTSETPSTTEPSSTTETPSEKDSASEADADKTSEKKTEETTNDTKTPKEPIKDDWKADWSDGATFTDHFFASRSKKWQDEEKLSYSAWRDRAKESYAAILDGALVKAGRQSKPQDEQQADNDVAPTTRGSLVHFIDCDHSGSPLDHRQKRRVLVRLGELVQERRGEGQDVVLVISSRTLDPGEKLCQKAGVSALSGVALSLVNPSQKKSEDRDLQRKGAINARRLRWILETGMAQPGGAHPNIEWLQSATGDDLARYGQGIWSINDVHRAAGQILARTWTKPQPVITSKHIDSVLRRLGLLKVAKAAEKNDQKEDSEKPETKGDEAVEEIEQDPLANITLDYHEERFRDCVIKTKELNVSWDDVILDQDTKEVIQNLVPSSKLEVEASSDLLLSQLRIRGCLLYGPPGTGKTHLCRAIASSSGSRMLSIDYATTQSSLVGKAEKYIHAAFTLAAKLHPCVLFIDEADALFYRRGSRDRGWQRGATTQFLVELDGLVRNPNAPLVVVATNRPWDLDEAFLRRLPQKLCIPLPDQASRAAILRLFLKEQDLDPAVDVDGMAAVTKGFSGSDLKSLCAEAALIWKVEQVKLDALCGAVSPGFATARRGGGQPRRLRLDVDHFAAAFEKMQPSRARDTADQLARFSQRYNPVQGELGRGNGGKRYVFNDASQKNEAFSVRELISRPLPAGGDSPANMQLVVWRSAEEVLFPGRAIIQASETPSSTERQSSEESIATCSEDEGPKDSEDGQSEPQAQSVEAATHSEFDIEKTRSTPDNQDLLTPDTPPAMSDTTTSERGGPEPTGPDLSETGTLAPEASKVKSGADIDLMPLLVTLAAVFWYS